MDINKNKKSQGLPLSFIVIAAISVLILVVIIFMVTGTGGKVAGTITGAQESDIATASSLCQNLCQQAQMASTYSQYKSSGFCNNKFKIDTGAGKTNIQCWSSEISTACPVSFSAGATAKNTKPNAPGPPSVSIGVTCDGAADKKCYCYASGCHAKLSMSTGYNLEELERGCAALSSSACTSSTAQQIGIYPGRVPATYCGYNQVA